MTVSEDCILEKIGVELSADHKVEAVRRALASGIMLTLSVIRGVGGCLQSTVWSMNVGTMRMTHIGRWEAPVGYSLYAGDDIQARLEYYRTGEWVFEKIIYTLSAKPAESAESRRFDEVHP